MVAQGFSHITTESGYECDSVDTSDKAYIEETLILTDKYLHTPTSQLWGFTYLACLRHDG